MTKVLVADVGEHRLGLPADAVEEAHPAVWVTPLPGAPVVVEGVVDLRGELVAVLDGRRRLGLPARPARLSDRLVVLCAGEHRVALRVDAVLALVEVPTVELAAKVVAAPAGLRGAGIARMDDRLLVVHDPASFLSPVESAALRSALAEVPRALAGQL